ncbi:MAG: hypothetical protein ACT4PV_14140 [Planctomycetaceae bacterium]
MSTPCRVPGTLVLWTLALAAGATTLEERTTCEMVARAERIACVACESVEARRDPRSGAVFTHVTLRLLEDWKGGGAGGVIRLRLVGGRDGPISTEVPLMPEFRPGEECVLFLGKRNDLGYDTVEFARRGVLRMEADETGARRFRDPVSGFSGLGGARRLLLEEVRTAIRGEVGRLEAERAGRGQGR